MTVSASGRSKTYATAPGVTGYPVPFPVISASDLLVYLHVTATFDPDAPGTVLTEGVHYTLAGTPATGAGSVVPTAAFPASGFVTFYRITSKAQTAAYTPNDGFPAATHEAQLDRLSLVDQETDQVVGDTRARSLMVPAGETAPMIPPAATLTGGNKIFAPDPVTGVFSVQGGSAFKGDPGGSPTSVGLLTALAGLTIPVGTDLIHASGFSSVGRGIPRLASAPVPSAIEQAAGFGKWVITTNAGTRWWRMAEEAPSDLMYGGDATGAVAVATDGQLTFNGPSATPGLQAAIDRAVYFGGPRTVRVPHAGIRILRETVQMGYGAAGILQPYTSINLVGEAQFAQADGQLPVTGLWCAFNDRPALNIQGARGASVRDLGLIGVNQPWLARAPLPFRPDRSLWAGPQMQAGTGGALDTSKAPYAGLVIDAYTTSIPANGAPPARPYPAYAYPAWLGATRQYQVNFSSGVVGKGITAQGFEVGCVVQPALTQVNLAAGENPASNGDFISYEDCNFSANIVGLAISHSDARCISLKRCRTSYCHTGIDTVTYGAKSCNANMTIEDHNCDQAFQLLNVDLTTGQQSLLPSIHIKGGYGEALYRFGTTRQSAFDGKPSGPLTVEAYQANLYLHAQEYTPLTFLDGAGLSPTTFKGGATSGSYGFLPINAPVSMVDYSIPSAAYSAFVDSERGCRIARTFIGGVWAPSTCGPVSMSLFQVEDFGGASAARVLRSEGYALKDWGGGQGVPISWFANTVRHAKGSLIPVPAPPTFMLDRGAYNLSGYVKAGTTHSFSFPRSCLPGGASAEAFFWFGEGDVIQDEDFIEYCIIAVAATSTTVSMTLRQLNAVRDEGDGLSTYNVMSSTRGALYFNCGRRVYPGRLTRLRMTTSTTSAAVTFASAGQAGLLAGELGSTGVATVSPGDYVLSSALTDGGGIGADALAGAKVTAVDYVAGTITFDRNPTIAGTFDAPFFVRAFHE